MEDTNEGLPTGSCTAITTLGNLDQRVKVKFGRRIDIKGIWGQANLGFSSSSASLRILNQVLKSPFSPLPLFLQEELQLFAGLWQELKMEMFM